MSNFKKAVVEQAYLKAGFMGFQGSGKTMTSFALMIGCILHARKLNLPYAQKPLFMVDTETGADFMVPFCQHFGIDLYVSKSRAFEALFESIKEAEAEASGLVIDSITHHWQEFQEAYKRRKKRSFIQFEDWAFLKSEWGVFTRRFINSQLHFSIDGRAGYEYDYHDREDGKRELEKTGIRMKAEGEFGFEPSLLTLMEREVDPATAEVERKAHVLKDRWFVIDGKTFSFPQRVGGKALTYDDVVENVWKAFSPYVLKLNWGGEHKGVQEDTSDGMIPEGEKPRWQYEKEQREILLEKLQALFTKHTNTATKEGRQYVIDKLTKHFGTPSWKELESNGYPFAKVKDGYNALHLELDGVPAFGEVAPVKAAA